MKDAKAHLDRHLLDSEFRFGDFIGDGFDIWKKGIGMYILFGLCFIILNFVLALIPIIGQLASSWLVSPAMVAGAYLFAHKLRKNERVEFGDFFSGFDNAAAIIVAYLIMTVIGIAFVIPLLAYFGVSVGFDLFDQGLDGLDSFSEIFTPGLIGVISVYALIGVYVAVLFSYVVHFITFYKLSGWDAIAYSAKYVHRHWFLVFFLIIVSGFIAMIGIVGFFIGVFVTLPIMFTISYASFRGLTDLDGYLDDNTDEDQEVLDSLII